MPSERTEMNTSKKNRLLPVAMANLTSTISLDTNNLQFGTDF